MRLLVVLFWLLQSFGPLPTTAMTIEPSSKMKRKLGEVSALYKKHFVHSEQDPAPSVIAVAPGRVNLIGEHVDYTGGFVLPFAIDYSTVVLGSGSINKLEEANQPSRASLRFVSSQSPDSVATMEIDTASSPPETVSWKTYVAGTIFQYLADLPQATELSLAFSICGDVPLGSGLSSSASLEVAVARFVESILGEYAFSSSEEGKQAPAKVRALRCQKAENEWAKSPCGLMDQYISSAGQTGSFLLIDCTSLGYQTVQMAQTDNTPVLVVANSNVKHDIGGGEYPVRVAQCQTATKALAQINPKIGTLRDATMADIEAAKDLMDTISFQRAKHVVTENERTQSARKALEEGDWESVGHLMNASHASMRDDYQVSCKEIDILVDIAQRHPGVYGSRLTGGGFGGCTVTLVDKGHAKSLIATLQRTYKEMTGLDCPCFETQPAMGAHVLPMEVLSSIKQ